MKMFAIQVILIDRLIDWICCTGGILSQFHTGVHQAPESGPFIVKTGALFYIPYFDFVLRLLIILSEQ